MVNRKKILAANQQEWEWDLDCIFPSVIEVPNHLTSRLGKYYLYYSCHDPPAGIGIAFSDSLVGPWIKYTGNPVLSRSCHHGISYGHISSPHVLYEEETKRFFMYYHGQDEWLSQRAIQTTGRAISFDGISWQKEEAPCIDADDDISWNSGELTYARVTRLSSESFVMVYMARDRMRSAPVLGYAVSKDGGSWIKNPAPLLRGGGLFQRFISSGQIISRQGVRYLIFCDESEDATNTTIKVCILDHKNLVTTNPTILIAPRSWPHWDRTRVHDPFILKSRESEYLFYASGKRTASVGIGITLVPDLPTLCGQE